MTNLNGGPDHNMWTSKTTVSRPAAFAAAPSVRRTEHGYTLVALLALMTILALFALAAAPRIQQQAQREREIEAIFRGEQIADAIRLYYANQVTQRNRQRDDALPTSIDQLLEGISRGSKKVQILRASAARDPLSQTGEWKLVRPRSMQLSDFQRSVMLYAGNIRPPTNDPQLKVVEEFMAPPVIAASGLTGTISSSSGDDSSSGPFIGVSPDSKRDSVLNYYGIDRHDGWIFTPLFR
jgi:type II secretory pathway pseudopilin PulG